MGDLSEHFSRWEFRCQCGECGFDTVDAKLLELLERVRRVFRQPVHINSGCRCPAHNAAEGGAQTSQHLFGRAADFRVEGHSAEAVYHFLTEAYPGRYGFGLYHGRVHADTRTNGPARWDSR